MEFVVNLRPKAVADIRRNVIWMAAHVSAASALRWQVQANTAIRSLASEPERCPLADESAEVGLDLRELLFGRGRHIFRALFTIDGTTVNVHRVRHAAQDRIEANDL